MPLLRTATQGYDNVGRISRKVDFKGQTNEFIYKDFGQIATNQFYSLGSSTPIVLASYNYDSKGRIHQIVEPRGENIFTYDNVGHVLQVASPEGTAN